MRRVLVAGLALTACFKQNPPAAPLSPTNAAAPIEIKRTGADYSATVSDPVGFLPIDSELVLSLDVEQLRRSGLWRMIEPRLVGSSGSTLAMLRAMCGIDPVRSIRGISFGFKNLHEDTPDGVLVVSGIDRQKLSRCVDKARGDGKQVTSDKGIVTISPDGGELIAFAFVDESTIVAMIGGGASADALGGVLRGGAPLRASPAFMEMFALIDVERGLWGMMNGSSRVFDKTASLGIRPKAIFGSVGLVADGLTGAVRVRFGDTSQPATIAGMAQSQLGSIKGMFERLDVTANNEDLMVDLDMTEQQVENIANLMGGAMGLSSTVPPATPTP